MSKHSIQNDPEIQQWIENERINYLIKSQAIKFGIFLSQHTRFEDFGSTSKESQEQIYQKFLETIKQQKVMNNNLDKKIPTIDLKIETKEVTGGIVYTPWMVIETPYIIYSDKNGTRKIWTKNKKKIALWFLYKITRVKWFIKKYNEQPR